MNVLHLIRIFTRNFWLLFLSAVFLAVLVYFLTGNVPKTYESKAKVYTGLGTAQSLDPNKPAFMDYYGMNNAFDNLISIIKSRETLEEVSLRLLAKHLLLDKADPKFISEKNYSDIMKMIPDDVKSLVVKDVNSENITTDTSIADTNSQTTQKSKPVEYSPVYHIVQPDETVYSIAKKNNINIDNLLKLNNLKDFNIKPGQKLLVSQRLIPAETSISTEKTSTEGNNIYYSVSDGETLESIALKFNISVKDLIQWNSLHERTLNNGQKLIVDKKDEPEKTIEKISIQTGNEEVVGQSALEKRLDKDFDNSPELEQTLRNLYNYKSKNDTNFIYGLLNYTYKHYSIEALNKIFVERIESSDLIEISYESDDPGICQYTLIILSKILIKNFKQIKENQSSEVVGYFSDEVERARQRLQKAEDDLLKFNKENNIINYDEQTKNIAAKKEELESAYQDERMNMVSAQAAIDKLEKKMLNQSKINLKNSEIIQKRDDLAKATSRIAYLETESEKTAQQELELQSLKIKVEKLKTELQKAIDEWYKLSNTEEGMPAKDLLNQWLDNVIRYEESKAKISVYTARIATFDKNYETFAPLGAQLKRIEREISVAEQEYLTLLKSLNEGKLKQQDIEFSSNVKVIDYPFYPLSPKSIKRRFLVVAAFLFGMFSIYLILVFVDFFDNSIKNTERIKKHSKLDIAGVFPFFPKRKSKIQYNIIKDRISDLIIQEINLSKTASGNIKPNITGIFSNRVEEGKSFTLKCVGEKMLNYGLDILCLSYQPTESHFPDNFAVYDIGKNYAKAKSIKDLLKNTDINSDHDYILIEFPALLTNNFPADLIKNLHQAYFICNAKRTWSDADTKSLDALKLLLPMAPKIVLNGATPDVLESILGEVPRKRSRFRVFLKKLITR